MRKSELENLYNTLSTGLNPGTARTILKATGRGGQSVARDYISACCLLSEVRKVNPSADLSLASEDDLWKMLHPATRFRMKAYTPCLAARYDELKEPAQKACFDDTDWVATEKMNGVRGWLICTPDGQVHLYSRNYSDVDCSLLNYWDNVYQTVKPHQDIFAIDVECMFAPGADISGELEELGLSTDGQLEAMVALLHMEPSLAISIQKKFKEKYGRDLIEFRLIAPLYFNNKNYVSRTLGEGMYAYNDCVLRAIELSLNVKVITRCAGDRVEKEHFLDSILNSGGEGVVFHNRRGMYCTSDNRSKEAFIKLKRSISATENGAGLGDTIDGFVSGFKVGNNGTANEGMVGALSFSVYVQEVDGRMRKHEIANVSGIDKALRQNATIQDASGLYPTEYVGSDGEVHVISLNPELDGLVAELSGQALSAVSQRLEHPRMIRWRVERSPESCIYSRAFLDSQTTASYRNPNAGITYSQMPTPPDTAFDAPTDDLPF